MSLRLSCAIAALVTSMTGAAQASSFVVIAPPVETPSIIALGAPDAVSVAAADMSRPAASDPSPATRIRPKARRQPGSAPGEQTAAIKVPLAFPMIAAGVSAEIEMVQVSASIVAYNAPAVTDEKVGAIDAKPALPAWAATPKLIRGGLIAYGGAGAAPSAPAAPRTPAAPKAPALPADRKEPAIPGAPRQTAGASGTPRETEGAKSAPPAVAVEATPAPTVTISAPQ